MHITKQAYGELQDGRQVDIFTLKNNNGMICKITNYGGIIVSLILDEKKPKDLVLGKPNLNSYIKGHPYFGALTGRVAGRINNATFKIDNKTYKLDKNDGEHCLHGGFNGWDKQLWNASIIKENLFEKLQLKYEDPDGNNNFPGTISCTVVYALLPDNSLQIIYNAKSDKDTPFNPTNHVYFNLNGEQSGTILNHKIQIKSDEIAETNSDMSLTGKKNLVTESINDLREFQTIGKLSELSNRNVDTHYFFQDGRTKVPRSVAKVYDPNSKNNLELLTTEPGVQFYAGINLSLNNKEIGKSGNAYQTYSGFCLETQDYPNSINHNSIGSAMLKAGEEFNSETIFKFY